MNDSVDLKIAEAVRHALGSTYETVSRLSSENDVLHRENHHLRRALGKARLLADLHKERAELAKQRAAFVIDSLPALLRRQAE